MRFLPLPRNAVLFIVMTTLVLLAWVVWATFKYPETLWSPGDLSRFHADIADCNDCHQPFRGAAAEKCIACHTRNSFVTQSKSTLSESHQKMKFEGKSCSDCHTEHSGALAQISSGALINPHGEFVFRATDTHSCSACHDFSARDETHAKLLDSATVRHLLEEGEGAHQLGKMGHCLDCHKGGRLNIKDEGD